MIEVNNLVDVTKDQIIDMLLEQGKQPFEIYVPKSTVLGFSTSEDIWMDYYRLAYTGQLLHDIAERFTYTKVPLDQHESVLFEISTNNVDSLAETLLHISFGYGNDPGDEDFVFIDYARELFDEVKNKKTGFACPYFMDICNEYEKLLSEKEEEE